MKKLLFSLCFIFCFSINSISQNPITTTNNNTFTEVVITVIDEKTKEIIKGANVFVINFPIYGNGTDENGQAQFKVANNQSEYIISVEAKGYHPYSDKININELNIGGISAKFPIKEIVEFYDLEVEIIDKQTKEFIKDASAVLIGKNTTPPIKNDSIVVFKNVSMGKSHIVKVEHAEYKTFYVPSPDNIDEKKLTIKAPMERDHFPVEIIIRDSGTPLKGASVNFLGFKGSEFKRKTNTKGVASFPSIEEGFKQIEISKSNFHTQINPITVAKKTPPEINQYSYTLRKKDSLIIEGNIKIEGTNIGLKNAAVRFKNNDEVHSFFTNEKGEFQMTKKVAYEDLRDFAFFLKVEHRDYRTFSTKELEVSHLEFLRNRKIVEITALDIDKKITKVPMKLSHPIFNEKYIKDCEYKIEGKENWQMGKCELMRESETVYLVLHAPDFWEEVRLTICTPKKMFGDEISRKDIEIKGDKNYTIKLYKNKRGKQCNADE